LCCVVLCCVVLCCVVCRMLKKQIGNLNIDEPCSAAGLALRYLHNSHYLQYSGPTRADVLPE
jgi:hypothetical protein